MADIPQALSTVGPRTLVKDLAPLIITSGRGFDPPIHNLAAAHSQSESASLPLLYPVLAIRVAVPYAA